MRIVQLIDSLEAGGAERMAVNYANALVKKISFSGLVASRAEGVLKDKLDKNVSYLFLEKKNIVDITAISKLAIYCKNNKVDILHAHSTSVFLAVLIKLLIPKIKIIWHDHYGNSEFLDARPTFVLKILLPFCAGAIAVNTKLLTWVKESLHFKKVLYLPNFAVRDDKQQRKTILNGNVGKRIVCLANLREQKNHFLLLDVAVKLKESHPNWSFHFIGKDFADQLSVQIKNRIVADKLQANVFLYGSCMDSHLVVCDCEIAVLSSKSEGLPLALLEYGMLSKVVLCTDVGEISSIIEDGKNGYMASSSNVEEYYQQLVFVIESKNRNVIGENLQATILENYGVEQTVGKYLKWLMNL